MKWLTQGWHNLITWLAHLPTKFIDHVAHDLRPGLFVASLVVVAEHIGFLSILNPISLLLITDMAIPKDANLIEPFPLGPIVIMIDQTTWEEQYLRRSPLDRCKLHAQLFEILAKRPKSLTIDLDLSPVSKEEDPQGCQQKLDVLLDLHASKVTLLSPFPVESENLALATHNWMHARCTKGIAFGEGYHYKTIGTVMWFKPNPNSLAKVSKDPSMKSICAEIGDKKNPAWEHRLLLPKENTLQAVEDETGGHPAGQSELIPINFPDYVRNAERVSISNLFTINHWKNRDVFFGGNYDALITDSFLTPIGSLSGVEIHAATRWSLEHKVKQLPHLMAFLLDILIAIVISFLIEFFWKQYRHHQKTKYGYSRESLILYLAMFFSSLCIWQYGLFMVAVVLYQKGTLINPLVIALGMLIDSFILGPLKSTLGEENLADKPISPIAVPRSLLALLVLLLSCSPLLWWATTAHLALLSLWGTGFILLLVLADHLLSVYILPAPQHHDKPQHGISTTSLFAVAPTGIFFLISIMGIVLATQQPSWDALDGYLPGKLVAVLTTFILILSSIFLLTGLPLVIYRHHRHAGTQRTEPIKDPFFSTSAHSWHLHLGKTVYLFRQYIFWAVVISAIYILMNQH